MERGAAQNKLRRKVDAAQGKLRRKSGAAQGKLRRNTGATLVLAMAVLLAAVMFSMVIVTGSVNAARAAWDQYSTEQSYLCVSAAARMLNREILRPTGAADEDARPAETADENAVRRFTAAVTRDGADTDGWPTLDGPRDFLASYGFSPEDETLRPVYLPAQTPEHPLAIRELLSFMYEQCGTGNGWTENGPRHSFTITLPLDGTRGRLVNAELSMYAPGGVREPYSLTATLSAGGGTGADEGKRYPAYIMRLEYGCTVRETEAERHETHYMEEEDGTLTPDYWESAKVTTTTLDWTLKKVGRGN